MRTLSTCFGLSGGKGKQIRFTLKFSGPGVEAVTGQEVREQKIVPFISSWSKELGQEGPGQEAREPTYATLPILLV